MVCISISSHTHTHTHTVPMMPSICSCSHPYPHDIHNLFEIIRRCNCGYFFVKGLYFQDNSMKQCFHAYPEVVFLDATYKLLEIGIPIYLLLCEDSNGTSEIVFACLLVKEDHESIIWMMETSKICNEL